MQTPSWATIRVVIIVLLGAIALVWIYSVLTGAVAIFNTIQALCCLIDIIAIFYPSIIDKIGDRSDKVIKMVFPEDGDDSNQRETQSEVFG